MKIAYVICGKLTKVKLRFPHSKIAKNFKTATAESQSETHLSVGPCVGCADCILRNLALCGIA